MENKNKKNQIRWLWAFITGAVLIIYGVYATGLFLRVGIDSDYSNLVLEATDILNGNPFLKGWNLTGISFVTTDLLFFIIGVLFAGTSIKAYFIAVITMFMLLILGAIFLSNCKNQPFRFTDLLIIFAVAGLPTVYGVNILRAHTAAAVYVLFAFYFLEKSRDLFIGTKNSKKIIYLYYSLVIFFLALGVGGDSITLIIGVAPIIIVSFYRLLGNTCTSRKEKYIFIILASIGAIIGKLIDIIFISIGKTNKNEFLENKHFGDLDFITKQFKLLISSILGMFNADFTNQKLISLNSLWYAIRICIIIFVFYIIIHNLILFLKRKDVDIISSMLSIGMLLMCIAIVFTDIMADKYAARYIGYFPVYSAILIIRYFKYKGFYKAHFFDSRLFRYVGVSAFCFILILSSLTPINLSIQTDAQTRLSEYLIDKNLNYGYAKFWNASHVTVASNNAVKVRAIIFDGQENMAQFHWFCKDEWYYPEYANFVVIENTESPDDGFGIRTDTVKKCFGAPQQVLNFENYSIYVYNYNISDKIIKYVREG